MFGLRSKPSFGLRLLGAWLIVFYVLPLFHIRFQGSETLLAVLGIAAGVFLILGR